MKGSAELRGDIVGGITTSVIALPLAIAFGIVALAPLGPEYAAEGALAGLYGVIVGGLLASLFGGTAGQISVPTAPMSVMVTSIIASLLADPRLRELSPEPAPLVLALVALTIAMAGLMQWLLAAVGGGRLVKFIPYPVVSGFMNGVAVIIFIGQLAPLFGLHGGDGMTELLAGDADWQLAALATGAATIVAMLLSRWLLPRFPAALSGLLTGVGVYLAIGASHDPTLLTATGNPLVIGPIPAAIPSPETLFDVLRLAPQVGPEVLTGLLVPAFTLSILAAIDTLLTSVVADMSTGTRHHSTRELMGQGLGNIGSACVGGLPVSGSTLATMVNLGAGGRSRLAGVVVAATVLLVGLFLGGLVQWIPKAALAGILLVTSVGMVETESVRFSLRRPTLANLVVIVAVTVITVLADLVTAVLVGLAITAVLYIREQVDHPIVHRAYPGNLVRSKKVRGRRSQRVLEREGSRIKVFELTGSLFFGTADRLVTELEQVLDSFCIILDFRRVHTVDLTGAQLLRQFAARVHERDGLLLLSHVDPATPEGARVDAMLDATGVLSLVGHEHVFPDTDHAQEWAEDALIAADTVLPPLPTGVDLRGVGAFEELTDDEVARVHGYLRLERFEKGDMVFEAGDPDDGMYFILSGGVSVLAMSAGRGGRARRLAFFGEGVFFGDMAILEGERRSASVRADRDTEALFLTSAGWSTSTRPSPRACCSPWPASSPGGCARATWRCRRWRSDSSMAGAAATVVGAALARASRRAGGMGVPPWDEPSSGATHGRRGGNSSPPDGSGVPSAWSG